MYVDDDNPFLNPDGVAVHLAPHEVEEIIDTLGGFQDYPTASADELQRLLTGWMEKYDQS